MTGKGQRFDDSFVIHMIRDFFLALLAIVALELGIRYTLVVYDFNTDFKASTQRAAERLANDVRAIMLNQGGPVAVRTVYPILRKNHEEIGFSIAIQPSPTTVNSIQSLFDFTPKGIPAIWPNGRFQEAQVAISAEIFCLQCHIESKPGDILGYVTVRGYLDTQLRSWWHEAQLTTSLGAGKILLHTIVLFLLLRVRMEPLFALQSVITLLAKAGTDLSHRASIKSRDEFGELARDLNLFLDRISQITDDLSGVLTSITHISERLVKVNDKMTAHYHGVDTRARELARAAYAVSREELILSTELTTAVERTLACLQEIRETRAVKAEKYKDVDQLVAQLERLAERTRLISDERAVTAESLIGFSAKAHDFSRWLGEMKALEERMCAVSDQGQTLLQRLVAQSD